MSGQLYVSAELNKEMMREFNVKNSSIKNLLKSKGFTQVKFSYSPLTLTFNIPDDSIGVIFWELPLTGNTNTHTVHQPPTIDDTDICNAMITVETGFNRIKRKHFNEGKSEGPIDLSRHLRNGPAKQNQLDEEKDTSDHPAQMEHSTLAPTDMPELTLSDFFIGPHSIHSLYRHEMKTDEESFCDERKEEGTLSDSTNHTDSTDDLTYSSTDSSATMSGPTLCPHYSEEDEDESLSDSDDSSELGLEEIRSMLFSPKVKPKEPSDSNNTQNLSNP